MIGQLYAAIVYIGGAALRLLSPRIKKSKHP